MPRELPIWTAKPGDRFNVARSTRTGFFMLYAYRRHPGPATTTRPGWLSISRSVRPRAYATNCAKRRRRPGPSTTGRAHSRCE